LANARRMVRKTFGQIKQYNFKWFKKNYSQ
jgi:hypothetical protein